METSINNLDMKMIMGQELNNIERMYDSVAKEYAETFSGEHEKKPKDKVKIRSF